ncbi:MAG: aminopeptidase P family protein [Marinosulfonomonas sp.]|nr:aminopeptidase P family protein [Marinosulfonomonas sp.]
MFQTFDVSARPEQGPPRLAALRTEISKQGLAGFLVPRADAHQGEYVAPCDARLAWLTGFTGSAGFCAALNDTAGVFVDGRYRLQVRDQISLDTFTPVDWPEVTLSDWLKEQLPKGGQVGFDAWLHTAKEVNAIRDGLVGSDVTLVAFDNLVDRIWADRPAPPSAAITAHPVEFAGKPHLEKRADLAELLRVAGQKAAVLTLPDSICWLLNVRGSDIARNPVAQAFAILRDDASVTLFTGPGKAAGIADHLGPDITIDGFDNFAASLAALTGPVRLDPATAPLAIGDILRKAEVEITNGDDPCLLPKACKNPVEIAGMQEAHLRDGAAMAEFLAWLDATAAKGGLSEIDVVRKLEGFRRATNALQEISFDTICGAGPNGAIVHYRVDNASNRAIALGELLLVDSGGQYLDGTTDITRTIAIGQPSAEHRRCFTRVLQGMIAISRLRFAKGRAGQHIEAIARIPLWMAGQDFDHGTGHGVGAYLSVHEGPQGLSRINSAPLEPGMILSNEPGYYRQGSFGIRIENLIVVRVADPIEGGDGRDMLAFETLAFTPIDRTLVDVSMLSPDERDWLNAYHRDVAEKIGPRLSSQASDWLTLATAPL